MTSKEQRKLQKRKEREKKNRKATLKRREVLRADAREKREEMRREKRIRKLQRELEHFDQVMTDRELAEASDTTLSQIEKNILILKALEAEHDREMKAKSQLNEKLEDEGYYTLEDKMGAARQLAVKKTEIGMGGSADCKVSVNKAPKDTAEVSVTKAEPTDPTENS